ncbi:MAG TPA: DUF2283 domain-containing protein [Dehalococcoidia bacterium]
MTISFNTEFDKDVGALYLRLREDAVEQTVEYSESIMVDVSDANQVVGVEFLELAEMGPFVQRFFPNIEELQAIVASHAKAEYA